MEGLKIDFSKTVGKIKPMNTDMELVKEEFFTSERFNILLKIKSYESYMIKFKPEKSLYIRKANA